MCSLQLWSNYHRLQYLINSDTRHCTTVQCSQCTLPCNKHQLFQSTLANVSQTDKTNLSVKYHLFITSWNTKSYERIFLNYIALIDWFTFTRDYDIGFWLRTRNIVAVVAQRSTRQPSSCTTSTASKEEQQAFSVSSVTRCLAIPNAQMLYMSTGGVWLSQG